jgi:hypothetical protein
MSPRRQYLWSAAALLYTAFAVSVTAVILSLAGPGPFGHPLVVAAVALALAVPGVALAYWLSTAADDPGAPQP